MKACRQHPKKANGRWCSCRSGWRYRMGLPDAVTGRAGRPEWSQTFPTKQAADAHQRETRQAIVDRTFTRDRGMTVGEFLTAWLARKEASGRKATTIAGYRSTIAVHLVPAIGGHRLGDLRADHVQAMLDRIASAPTRQVGRRKAEMPSTGTLINVRAVLRAALADAERQQLVGRNVAQLVQLPAVKRPRPIAVEDTRLATFMRGVQGDPLEALWHMAAVYGPRRGELAGLRWEDIDEAAQLIRIRHTLSEVEGDHACVYCSATHRRLLFGTPKSAAGERIYPLVPEVAASLMEHRRRQDHERELFGADYADHGLVFAQPDGNPWRPAWISLEFKRLMKVSGAATGLDRVPSIKSMRSTMVTALHEQGASLEVISKVTGHADDGVTRDHYLSISAERTRSEFEAIAARVAGRSDRHSDRSPETGADGLEGGGTS